MVWLNNYIPHNTIVWLLIHAQISFNVNFYSIHARIIYLGPFAAREQVFFQRIWIISCCKVLDQPVLKLCAYCPAVQLIWRNKVESEFGVIDWTAGLFLSLAFLDLLMVPSPVHTLSLWKAESTFRILSPGRTLPWRNTPLEMVGN